MLVCCLQALHWTMKLVVSVGTMMTLLQRAVEAPPGSQRNLMTPVSFSMSLRSGQSSSHA